MGNDFYTKNQQFDYLDYMDEMKKLSKKKYIEKLFKEAPENIYLFLLKIKSLGLEINEYLCSYKPNPYLEKYNNLLKKNTDTGMNKVLDRHLKQVDQLQNLFVESNKSINKELDESIIDPNHILAIFIIFLERQLRLLREQNNLDISLEQRVDTYDTYVFSSGNILKYLLHNISLEKQCGINRIFSEKNLLWNINVYSKYQERDNLMDAFEYWKYSDIRIEEIYEKVIIDFLDEDFNRAVLVSNFRYKRFMTSIELDILNYKLEKDRRRIDGAIDEELTTFLSEELCRRYIGQENLDKKVHGIEIRKWIEGIYFLQHESILYSNKKKNRNIYSVQNLCVVKTKYDWIKKLSKFSQNISKKEAKMILEKFIFTGKSKDLIDAPLIKIQDKLILLPTLAKEIRPLSVILSMFSRDEEETQKNREDIALGFKGAMFEQRTKHLLQVCSQIDAKRLHIKITKEKDLEREIDLAFVLDKTLFLFECKSFNQPYTVREHAKTNKKIKETIKQLNKNADYFEENISITLKQLGLSEEISIEKVQRVLLTSTILGEAGKQENVLVVDEASFNAFLLRNPPTVSHIDGAIKERICLDTENIYSGKITAEKLLVFLRRQLSVKIMQSFIVKTHDSDRKVEYKYCKKDIEDSYIENDVKIKIALDRVFATYEKNLSE
ncbi:NERD domain-containing protein [Enterococcus casseliflavus]|uniref:NERD domain-containing protein n=1 Tax=Enterococcus casseliflavus TaxID=37734 RepID=UPI0032E39259